MLRVQLDGRLRDGLVPGDDTLDLAVGAEELFGLMDDVFDVQGFYALLGGDQRRTAGFSCAAAFAQKLGDGLSLQAAQFTSLLVALARQFGYLIFQSLHLTRVDLRLFPFAIEEKPRLLSLSHQPLDMPFLLSQLLFLQSQFQSFALQSHAHFLQFTLQPDASTFRSLAFGHKFADLPILRPRRFSFRFQCMLEISEFFVQSCVFLRGGSRAFLGGHNLRLLHTLMIDQLVLEHPQLFLILLDQHLLIGLALHQPCSQLLNQHSFLCCRLAFGFSPCALRHQLGLQFSHPSFFALPVSQGLVLSHGLVEFILFDLFFQSNVLILCLPQSSLEHVDSGLKFFVELVADRVEDFPVLGGFDN